jgi:hypothetical protein
MSRIAAKSEYYLSIFTHFFDIIFNLCDRAATLPVQRPYLSALLFVRLGKLASASLHDTLD